MVFDLAMTKLRGPQAKKVSHQQPERRWPAARLPQRLLDRAFDPDGLDADAHQCAAQLFRPHRTQRDGRRNVRRGPAAHHRVRPAAGWIEPRQEACDIRPPRWHRVDSRGVHDDDVPAAKRRAESRRIDLSRLERGLPAKPAGHRDEACEPRFARQRVEERAHPGARRRLDPHGPRSGVQGPRQPLHHGVEFVAALQRGSGGRRAPVPSALASARRGVAGHHDTLERHRQEQPWCVSVCPEMPRRFRGAATGAFQQGDDGPARQRRLVLASSAPVERADAVGLYPSPAPVDSVIHERRHARDAQRRDERRHRSAVSFISVAEPRLCPEAHEVAVCQVDGPVATEWNEPVENEFESSAHAASPQCCCASWTVQDWRRQGAEDRARKHWRFQRRPRDPVQKLRIEWLRDAAISHSRRVPWAHARGHHRRFARRTAGGCRAVHP
jgi:hypothetical protein